MRSTPKRPLVVILTPVYNGAEFIAETMRSIQEQTYESIRHVVIDNCSTDGTDEIVKSFQGRKVEVQHVRFNELVSQRENWMRAIDAVPSDAGYFRLLCADDLLRPEYVERCVALASQDPDVVEIGAGCEVSGVIAGRVIKETQPVKWPEDRDIYSGAEATRLYLLGRGMIVGPQLMFKRRILEHMPDFFRGDIFGFDTDAALRALRFGSFAMVRDMLCTIRVQENSVSHTEMHPQRQHFIDWMYYIGEYGRVVLSPTEYCRVLKLYKRYYLRRLILWSRETRSLELLRFHLHHLGDFGMRPTSLDWADAVIDVPLRRLSLRQDDPSGHPLG